MDYLMSHNVVYFYYNAPPPIPPYTILYSNILFIIFKIVPLKNTPPPDIVAQLYEIYEFSIDDIVFTDTGLISIIQPPFCFASLYSHEQLYKKYEPYNINNAPPCIP